jgi:hypothetical protein
VWMFASMSLAQTDLAEEPEQQMTETAEYVAV